MYTLVPRIMIPCMFDAKKEVVNSTSPSGGMLPYRGTLS